MVRVVGSRSEAEPAAHTRLRRHVRPDAEDGDQRGGDGDHPSRDGAHLEGEHGARHGATGRTAQSEAE